MDNFATRGAVNVGDALAALALVRALLKTLQAKKCVIGTSDVNSIVADALGQIGPLSSTDAGREARRLIQKFNQPSNQPSTTARPTEETTDLSNFNPPKSSFNLRLTHDHLSRRVAAMKKRLV